MNRGTNMENLVPASSRVVIIGGGIAGCSVAYQLSKLGWNDVTVLEKGNISGGTTWHAAGMVTQLRNSRTLIDINRATIEIYSGITDETGIETGFRRNGSVSVAKTVGRMDEFKKIASLASTYGVDIRTITPKQAGEMWPIMRTDDLIGGLYIPKDGQIVPHLAAQALARGAELGGVKLVENVEVTDILKQNDVVKGVVTTKGQIKCEYVVITAGMWSREIGLKAGIKIPLMAAEHMYLVTNPMGLPYGAEGLRDPDEQIYFRRDQEEKGAILMGGFEWVAKPWIDGPNFDNSFGLVEPDWDHFKVFWESAIYRVPSMAEAGIDRLYVSGESFTPDNRYILGEAPEVKNIFLCTGLNSTGIAAGPGSGQALAEWIVNGYPTLDLWEVDPRRFHESQNTKKYLYERTVETVGSLYGMHWPHKQMETARMIRKSPFHDRIKEKGACFGEAGTWERPNWFAPEGVDPVYEYSFGRQNWFKYSEAEHLSVRNAVGLFDLTSFSKFVMEGSASTKVLQNLCANDIDVPPGGVIYTSMLNKRGGIEADLTITRLAEDKYFIVTGGAVGLRDFGWIQSHIKGETGVSLIDMTSSYSTLGLMGPFSRGLLSKITDTDVSNESFPFMTSQRIEIGSVSVRATRITYVGELGWELYIPTESAAAVFDIIKDNGTDYGLHMAGFHAMESLRIEKSYRAWGHDICDLDTPIEAGLGFVVSMDKPGGFIGKEALIEQLKTGLNKRLAVLILEDPAPISWGDEAIFRDGQIAGRTTSGAFGHTIGRSVAMGYIENNEGVDPEYIRTGSYEIEILSQRYKAKVQLKSPYDPKGLRVRS